MSLSNSLELDSLYPERQVDSPLPGGLSSGFILWGLVSGELLLPPPGRRCCLRGQERFAAVPPTPPP